jgi:hypothetical protein
LESKMAETEATAWYDYNGLPAYRDDKGILIVTPGGEEKPVQDLVKFVHEAQPITEAEFRRLKGSEPRADEQERVPAGSPEGGQFASGSSGEVGENGRMTRPHAELLAEVKANGSWKPIPRTGVTNTGHKIREMYNTSTGESWFVHATGGRRSSVEMPTKILTTPEEDFGTSGRGRGGSEPA